MTDISQSRILIMATDGFEQSELLVPLQKLKEAGAIILGKTTMHELAAGIVTVGSSFGQTRNPYDLDRTPGGSSGGAAAWAAHRMVTRAPRATSPAAIFSRYRSAPPPSGFRVSRQLKNAT